MGTTLHVLIIIVRIAIRLCFYINGTISRATMLTTLIIGLIAGPAVSL
jgi:hypothetical protein